jgi:predicted deacylase
MGAPVELKAQRFAGGQPGPHLLITAGVHGDEHVPMQAVRDLIQRFQDDTALRQSLNGSLTLVSVVNESAFARGHRCGSDDLDLARTCPGAADGTDTEQTAFALSSLIESADFYIDLHSGGTELSVFPLTGYVLHTDEKVLETQRSMARVFNLPFVWGTSAELNGRSLSVARDAGVPAIYVEYLGGISPCPEGRARCVEGCLNVMGCLGILDRDPPPCAVEETIEDPRPQSGHMQICNPAPITGFFEARVKLGQTVAVGDVLGSVSGISGDETRDVLSQQAGRVIVLREYPRVNAGESIGVIAEREAAP